MACLVLLRVVQGEWKASWLRRAIDTMRAQPPLAPSDAQESL